MPHNRVQLGKAERRNVEPENAQYSSVMTVQSNEPLFLELWRVRDFLPRTSLLLVFLGNRVGRAEGATPSPLRFSLFAIGPFRALTAIVRYTFTNEMREANIAIATAIAVCDWVSVYYEAQNDYTHIFITLELISQLHRTFFTQSLPAGIVLCHSGPS